MKTTLAGQMKRSVKAVTRKKAQRSTVFYHCPSMEKSEIGSQKGRETESKGPGLQKQDWQ